MADGTTHIAFTIETGIPIPPKTVALSGAREKRVARDAIRALVDAPLFASVFLPLKDVSRANALSDCAYQLGGPGWVTVRHVGTGYRAWKVMLPSRQASESSEEQPISPSEASAGNAGLDEKSSLIEHKRRAF